MEKKLLLLTLPFLWGCGNTAQQNSGSNTVFEKDSIGEVIVTDTIMVTDVPGTGVASSDYSSQESDVVKEFYVTADVYKVNTTTMEMTYRGKENLHVKLYTNHTAYAVGDNGASMQVYESSQSGYDFMCNVYGNKYIYFFNSDEIQ